MAKEPATARDRGVEPAFFALFLWRLRSSGESLDGGKCEFLDFLPNDSVSSATRLVSSATCCCRAAISTSRSAS